MNKRTLPYYSYPTTAILIDDSEHLLTKMSLEFDTKLAYVTFSDPRQALSYIKDKSQPHSLVSKAFVEDISAEDYGIKPLQHAVKINLEILLQQVYNADRFNEPSVLVVDYSMPQLDGFKLCKLLKEYPIKIIMLTGEADTEKGIQWFNEGLIDRFIQKNDSEYSQKVNAAIIELQQDYFREQSIPLFKSINTTLNACLEDLAFIHIFKELCKNNDIVEYYPIEMSGSFLLLDYEGKASWLLVKSAADLHDYYEIAADHKAPPALLKLLKSGQKIPYFSNFSEMMEAEGAQWEAYLYPTNKIEGKTTYYYSYIKTSQLFELNYSKILSYKDYLSKVWPPV